MSKADFIANVAKAGDMSNAEAKRGMSQVIEFLLNEAEAAIFRSDWELARDTAAKVLAMQPKHKHATDLSRRAVRLQRVEKLVDRAVDLYAAGRLTLPADDNAAAVYQEVLKLDPGNAAAKQGLESIVQRTIAHAESSMYAGKVDQANAYLERARAIDPNAPGMATVEKTRETWTDIQQGLATKENLLAAAEALQADRLTPPAEPNAFSLYSEVLSAEPDNEAAKRGLDLVRKGVLEKAQTMLATGNLRAANAHAETAEQVGADAVALNGLRDEIAYQQQLLDAQAGRFDSLYPIREMTPIRQSAPTFPRTAPEGATGTVNLHFTVSITGDVRDVEVVNNPEPYFAKAASRAVEKWQFKPVMERGRPIPVRVAVRLVFN